MNCFDWQNRASDYLDGALIGASKREADEHLESCEACGTRYKHYRLILTSIASQPRVSLPVSIRKAPFKAPLPKESRFRLRETFKVWSHAPWYVKFPLESAAIVVLISLAISTAPRVRSFYERKMERSLTEYAQGFGTQDFGDDSTGLPPGATAAVQPVAATATAQTTNVTSVAKDSATSEDDFAGGDSDSTSDEVVKAGKSEIWRFNLKSDSPTDLRAKVLVILKSMNFPPATAGLGGIEVPGGIQFDLMVPRSFVPEIKSALEKIAPVAPKDTEDTPLSETFTWYKSRSKRPVPSGQTHVVIWISQI